MLLREEYKAVFNEGYSNNKIEIYFPAITAFKGLSIGGRLNDGVGGFATVYKLKDGLKDTNLVVKVIDTANINIFFGENHFTKICQYAKNEKSAMLKCNGSDYIMPLYGYYEKVFNGRAIFYFIMPQLTDITRILYSRRVGEAEYCRLIEDMAIALDTLAQNHILHRDIKANNIFFRFTEDNKKIQYVLGDLGISKYINDDTVEMTKFNCVAPEIVKDEPLKGRFNSDIYLLFKCIEKSIAKNRSDSSTLSKMSTGFQEIIRKGTEENPELRYQNGKEIIKDLEKITSKVPKIDENELSYTCENAFVKCKDLIINTGSNFNVSEAIVLIKDYIEENANCANIYALLVLKQYFNPKHGYNQSKEFYEIVSKAKSILDFHARNGSVSSSFLSGYIETFLRTIAVRMAEEKEPLLAQSRIGKFKDAADSGHPIAQYYYAKLLIAGRTGVKKDFNKGIEYMVKAIQNGYKPAFLYLRNIIDDERISREKRENLVRVFNFKNSYGDEHFSEITEFIKNI